MQLDDVVSSVCASDERFAEASARSVRWLDRCIAAHKRPNQQNLFAIVQGGLDVSPGKDPCAMFEAWQYTVREGMIYQSYHGIIYMKHFSRRLTNTKLI